MISRRNFLRNSSIVAASSLSFPAVAKPAGGFNAKPGQRPRNIIHMVADGMSMGTLTCADYFSRRLRGRGLTWLQLQANPKVYSGLMNMRSLNSIVTDSSAASSSWGCGARIINGTVNQRGNGDNLTTLYQLFAQASWKRALVTTTEITHATPAGFATNAESRDHADKIALQYIERKVDLLLGGGYKFFDRKERKDKRDLFGEAERDGYYTMRSLDELKTAPTDQRWLGVFDKNHLPFTIDQRESYTRQMRVPTLATMTSAALKWLERHPHFILQVEGGRVDHACHNCDGVTAMHELVAFDEAIDACLGFQQRVPDTLIVMTTDHGNANLGLNGMGSAYGQSTWLFNNALHVRKSFSELLDLLRKTEKTKIADIPAKEKKAYEMNPAAHPHDTKTAADKDDEKDEDEEEKKKKEAKEKDVILVKSQKEIIEIIEHWTGYKVSPKKADMLAPFLSKKGDTLYDVLKADVAGLGHLMANHVGIGFTGNAHTADYVAINAVGPGAEKFGGFVENTDVFYHYLNFGKIDFRNPTEPLITESDPAAEKVEPIEEYKLA
jgi:alkaline phosphatase